MTFYGEKENGMINIYVRGDKNVSYGIVLDTINNGDTVLNISLKNGLIHGLWIERHEPFSGNKGQYFLL